VAVVHDLRGCCQDRPYGQPVALKRYANPPFGHPSRALPERQLPLRRWNGGPEKQPLLQRCSRSL
jgi:hypothetical protein